LLNDLRGKIVADQQSQEDFEKREAEVHGKLQDNSNENIQRLTSQIKTDTESLSDLNSE
jgi:hypothetical protein